MNQKPKDFSQHVFSLLIISKPSFVTFKKSSSIAGPFDLTLNRWLTEASKPEEYTGLVAGFNLLRYFFSTLILKSYQFAHIRSKKCHVCLSCIFVLLTQSWYFQILDYHRQIFNINFSTKTLAYSTTKRQKNLQSNCFCTFSIFITQKSVFYCSKVNLDSTQKQTSTHTQADAIKIAKQICPKSSLLPMSSYIFVEPRPESIPTPATSSLVISDSSLHWYVLAINLNLNFCLGICLLKKLWISLDIYWKIT